MSTNALARDFEATLALSPGYDPIRAADPGLSFWATFRSGLGSIVGPQPNLQRESAAIERSPLAGRLRSRTWNVSRPEIVTNDLRGTLLELTITNKCANHNARPDAGLTGITLGGDPAASLYRQSDVEQLRLAGLDEICPGYAIVLDNRAGAGDAWATIAGEAGTLNPQAVSLYCRGHGAAEIGIEGISYQSIVIPAAYGRFIHSDTPDQTTRRMEIRAKPGAIIYWVLNQYEEISGTATSPIETLGAPTSRQWDKLTWPTHDQWDMPLASNQEGMIASTYRLTVDNMPSVMQPGRNWVFYPYYRITLYATGSSLIVAPYLQSDCLNAQLSGNLPDAPAGAPFVLTLRWNSATGEIELGVLYDGQWSYLTGNDYHAWQWWPGDPPDCNAFYDDIYFSQCQSAAPYHFSDVRMWSENRGRAWLEAFFDA